MSEGGSRSWRFNGIAPSSRRAKKPQTWSDPVAPHGLTPSPRVEQPNDRHRDLQRPTSLKFGLRTNHAHSMELDHPERPVQSQIKGISQTICRPKARGGSSRFGEWITKARKDERTKKATRKSVRDAYRLRFAAGLLHWSDGRTAATRSGVLGLRSARAIFSCFRTFAFS